MYMTCLLTTKCMLDILVKHFETAIFEWSPILFLIFRVRNEF